MHWFARQSTRLVVVYQTSSCNVSAGSCHGPLTDLSSLIDAALPLTHFFCFSTISSNIYVNSLTVSHTYRHFLWETPLLALGWTQPVLRWTKFLQGPPVCFYSLLEFNQTVWNGVPSLMFLYNHTTAGEGNTTQSETQHMEIQRMSLALGHDLEKCILHKVPEVLSGFSIYFYKIKSQFLCCCNSKYCKKVVVQLKILI